MAVSTQVVRFTKDTSGTTNATQDVALNFTPKAIIVFSDCATGDNSAAAHYQWSQGFSDGTNTACSCITSDDADNAADTQQVHSVNSVYVRMNETNNATVLERATCAFITNAVRFTWAVASTTATRICMWAIGGDDITNVKVGSVDVNTTSTGTIDYTGLGFNPVDGESVLFTLGTGFSATGNASVPGSSLSFGCAVSASKEWAINNVMEDTRDPSDTWRVTYSNHCSVCLTFDGGVVDYTAEFSSWITDGFRLNYTNAPSLSTLEFIYLVIKGGTWDAGTITSPTTATNNVDYAVSVSSRTLRGIMITGCASTVSATIDTHAIVSVGAADGTTQATISCIDEDAQPTMDSYRINNATNIINQLTLNGAVENVGTFDSFGTNSFRIDHTTQVAFSQLYGWVVVADGPPTSQQYPVSISEPSVSVSENLARVQTLTKSISDTPTISVSEQLTRGLGYTKSINETSVSVSESLERVQVKLKPISETAVTVSAEQLTRIQTRKFTLSESTINTSELLTATSTQQYSRPISESTISVSEELARVQSLIKLISDTPTISVSEQLTKSLAYTKSISTETTISVSETLSRLQTLIKTISETSVSIPEETLARIQYLIKTITDSPIISVSEQLTRGLAFTKSILESPSITTDDTIVRIPLYLKPISETPTITTNDSIARWIAISYTLAESQINISELLVGQLGVLDRTITETTISVNDTIAKILLGIKTISDPSISVNDTIARIQTILKQISEDAISINDTIQAGLLLTISLVESRVKWYYSLLTRKITGGGG